MRNTSTLLAMSFLLVIAYPATSQENDQDEQHEQEARSLQLTDEQRLAGEVETAKVAKRVLEDRVRVPGEVSINAYQSSRVTPRITAQVSARHVRLGDRVETGQSMVTLSSVEMAEAQGELIVADREWRRVKKLGSNTVSARRYTEAQVAQQQALAKVLAYGMTEAQAAALAKSGNASKATGQFDLLSPQSGTVLADDFIVGELIEPGRTLFAISDESSMWVEARVHANSLPSIAPDAAARVSLDGANWLEGTLVQRHHSLDETTRTRGLRIQVDNTGDLLHPGQFVEVEIITGGGAPVLAIPNSALTIIEGTTSVFKLERGNEFHAEAVETGSTAGNWTVITSGLSEGDEVATDGVFHLKSLLLKSSLGEVHGH